MEIFSINKGRIVTIETQHLSISMVKKAVPSKECFEVLWQALMPESSLLQVELFKAIKNKIVGSPFNNNGNFD